MIAVMRTYFDEIVWQGQTKETSYVPVAVETYEIRLLLRKLGPIEHEKYVNYILPKKSADISHLKK